MAAVLCISLLTTALPSLLAAPPAGKGLLGELPPPVADDRLVDPRQYPDFSRRAFATPTWDTFDGRPQLVGGRYHGARWDIAKADLTRLVPPGEPMDGRPWFIGRVYRPDLGMMRAKDEDFRAGVERMAHNGMYLFNIGGYGPGSPWRGSFGQAAIPEDRLRTLREVLGERFLGFDLGEQDGRYHNSFEQVQLPVPRDAAGQMRLFHDWCDRVIDDQGGKLSLLSTLWNWHHPVRDGAMTLIGAECHNKDGVTNAQVQYAFLRGAGRQYGVLWFGDVSVFSTFGLSGWHLDDEGRLVSDPGGGSANVMRRLFLTQWLWNCCILGFEGKTVADVQPERRRSSTMPRRPSPIGLVQMGVEKMLQEGFAPGVLQTPVALLFDELAGWMPARTNRVQFRVWNDLPYGPSDHFADGVLSLLFPGYEDCGWYMDERGALVPTPHGDIADCLLGAAAADVLARYGLVICAGITSDVLGVRQRLDAFTTGGGTVLATGDDAARLWPEWFPGGTAAIPATMPITWRDSGHDTVEADAFLLREIAAGAEATVLADCAGRPAVVRVPRGAGSVIVLCAATGLAREARPCRPGRHAMWGGANTGLERPFPLLTHVREAVNAALESQRLFTAGDGLTVTTSRRDATTFTVGVGNPGLQARPFDIRSHIGRIARITEVEVGPSIHDLPGYWPHSWGAYDPKAKPHRADLGELTGEPAPGDPARIGGGDMRLFTVELAECSLQRPPPTEPTVVPRGRVLALPDLFTLRARLLAWPSFARVFEGVAVDWPAVRDTDSEWLRTLGRWLARHHIRVVVDARDAPESELDAVVESLGALGGRRDLVRSEARPELAARCATLGIEIRPAAAVARLSVGAPVPTGSSPDLQILESDWRSWDAIAGDARAAWQSSKPQPLTGVKPILTCAPKAARSGPPRLLAVHDAASPEAAVAMRPGFHDTFNGLMLDVDWLLSRGTAALERDRAWLHENRIEVVIDFTRSLNRFPDLTFSSVVPHQRDASKQCLAAALGKMRQLGTRHAVACSHMRAETTDDWEQQRAGIEEFLREAAAAQVTVHWRASRHRPPGGVSATAAFLADLRARHPNLRMAACTVEEPDVGRLLAAMQPAGAPELWLAAAPGETPALGTAFLPLSAMPRAQLAGIVAAAGDAMVVADADYSSWDEVLADVEATKRAASHGRPD